MSHTYSLSKADYEKARKTIVYAWIRGAQWLYVGMSTQGLARIYGAHEKINKREPMQGEDEIRIWEREELEAARILELLLIEQHTPKYNKTGNPLVPIPHWAGHRQRRKDPQKAPGTTWTGLKWNRTPVQG